MRLLGFELQRTSGAAAPCSTLNVKTRFELEGYVANSLKGVPPPTRIDFTDHQGVRRTRNILPLHCVYGSNTFYIDAQWLLVAQDLEVSQVRVFAVRDIHSFGAP